MRLTTKIITGIILSIFLISLTFIIGFSFTDRKTYSSSNINDIELPQDNMTSIELAAFKTIVIDEIQQESQNHSFSIRDFSSVNFDSIPEENNPDMLFIPESLKDFIIINTSDDTLTIKLNINELGAKYKSQNFRYQYISGINMRFCTSKIDVINKLRRLSVNIKNIETDSIKIKSHGKVFIDSCKVQFMDPFMEAGYERLKITNCDIKRINLDLDHIHSWNIEKCNIEERFFTGSRGHNIILHNEPAKINWIPKNENAALNIKIQGDTTQIIIQ